MARPDRLFHLLTALRKLPQPVTAARLAAETGVSERSLYRDIATLRAGGMRIDGAPGSGYRLAEASGLPPPTLTPIEVEAVLMGLAEVRRTADPALAAAAQAAEAQVIALLPDPTARHAAQALQDAYGQEPRPILPHIDLLRPACRDESELRITYRDEAGGQSSRAIWPLALLLQDRSLTVLAWCCLRQDFRHFDPARIGRAERTGQRFATARAELLRRYRDQPRGGD